MPEIVHEDPHAQAETDLRSHIHGPNQLGGKDDTDFDPNTHNNKAIIELLDHKGTGIFQMLDEELSIPRGSDEQKGEA